MTTTRKTGFLAGLVLLACSFPTDTCGCSQPLAAAVVRGTAVDSAGAAVPGVLVSGLLFDSSCAASRGSTEVSASDDEGRFELHVVIGQNPEQFCIELTGIRNLAAARDTVTLPPIRSITDYSLQVIEADLVFPVRTLQPDPTGS